ncbi:MAG: transcription termination/antitermination protein NusA [Phycisphaerae bacterium]|nr:transcription termination/antitermination protein NusA [Phycisphaerae bacterium]
MNAELVRIVDSIARDKNIEKDEVYLDLEQAMESAVRKAYGQLDEVKVSIDRLTGDISAARNGQPIDMRDLGRIAAQTAKQVMIQKIREAERGSIFDEFQDRKGTVVTGTVSRYEGGALIINLGRAEGFLPKSEQIPGETHHPGERIRTLILDVRESPHQVKIVLSRSHPDFIRRLFELEVPEVSERIIEVKALAREAGYRTKIAVSSIDMKVDAVGACVGVRGSRIKNIVVELGGEKIDIVRWNESSQILINNALKPAEVEETALCFELGRATVVVPDDQLSLAIGKRGQNVRLAARLTGWDIDILTPKEYNKGLDDMEKVLSSLEGMTSEKIEKMMAMGIISLGDVEEIGVEPLMKVLGLSEELAQQVISTSSEAAKRLMAEAEAAKAAAVAAAAAESAATSVTDGVETDSEIRSATAAEEAGAVDGATVPSDAGDGPKPEAPAEPLGTEGVQTPETGASQQPA